MTKRIVVGFDGSAPAAKALLWAATEAAARDARLRIVSCYEIPLAAGCVSGWAATEAYGSLLDGCRDALEEAKALAAEAAPGVEIELEASAGPASSVLIDRADADDLVVVGASSHHGSAAFWLGSTPRYLVRHSPCPVVVVRGTATRVPPDRVVVGVDGSPPSDQALRWAGAEADRHGVSLLVVHAWLYPYLPVDMSSSQARDLTNVDAACLLERSIESVRDQFATDVSGELVEGGAVSALLEIIRDGDLLVVGSRGRGALASSLFGSTANAVLDQCSVPVVVVREVACD